MGTAKIQEILGRAAVDHRFCHRLEKSLARACRQYHLSEGELDELRGVLSLPVSAKPAWKKRLGLAGLATGSVMGLLLGASAAFADGGDVCLECPPPNKGAVVSEAAMELKIDMAEARGQLEIIKIVVADFLKVVDPGFKFDKQ